MSARRATEVSMKHLVRIVMTLAVAGGFARAAAAQGVPTPASDLIWSAQVDVAATLGRKSSSSVGGEVGLRLTDRWETFLEIGRMRNVTSKDLETRAKFIGDAIGATSNPIQKATYFDVGARYNVSALPAWHPFLLAGLGFARVNTSTTFSQNGRDITGQIEGVYGVQLGLDLEGSVTKAFFTLGGGVMRPFKNRYFAEGTYRYGRIFPRTGLIPADKGVNTQRVQLGVGLRF
jgi:opacity protein-like surface antigen